MTRTGPFAVVRAVLLVVFARLLLRAAARDVDFSTQAKGGAEGGPRDT